MRWQLLDKFVDVYQSAACLRLRVSFSAIQILIGSVNSVNRSGTGKMYMSAANPEFDEVDDETRTQYSVYMVANVCDGFTIHLEIGACSKGVD